MAPEVMLLAQMEPILLLVRLSRSAAVLGRAATIVVMMGVPVVGGELVPRAQLCSQDLRPVVLDMTAAMALTKAAAAEAAERAASGSINQLQETMVVMVAWGCNWIFRVRWPGMLPVAVVVVANGAVLDSAVLVLEEMAPMTVLTQRRVLRIQVPVVAVVTIPSRAWMAAAGL